MEIRTIVAAIDLPAHVRHLSRTTPRTASHSSIAVESAGAPAQPGFNNEIEGIIMKYKSVLTAAAASLLLAGVAVAQPSGMGPGMMGGYGGGPGGWGPGMMGGYGAGPGGWAMGPGMMWGDGGDAYAGLNLSPEQRQKIADIREAAAKSMWQLMGTMHEQGYRMYRFGAGAADEAQARKAYDQMAATQKAMFELRLETRRKIDAVLTPEQRDQLRRYWGGR